MPDAAYYQQQEADLITAVCNQVMRPTIYLIPLTKQDTIGVYDSLRFPAPLPEREIERLTQSYKLSSDFIALLRDTANRNNSPDLTVAPPLRGIAAGVPFTPKLIAPRDEAFATYRFSRAVFNAEFSKAYFQLAFTDPGEELEDISFARRELIPG
ncbi:hypothetical protein [Hymenobacter sp. B81]|uniref:hypothetical protein n=1 Tax=Hymenobacter sp. B81 TaxID=3344878 RepID=UPI0037DC5A50